MRAVPSTNDTTCSGCAQLARPQALQGDEQDLLHEIRRRVRVTQMLETV